MVHCKNFAFLLSLLSLLPPALTLAAPLSAIWVNDGGDKVTRDELRASQGGQKSVSNSLWNGTEIALFGAKNEVISFNLILEAATGAASELNVALNQLVGPSGALIRSSPAQGQGVFDWSARDIELFFIRYLPIKSLSQVFYGNYDERHIPARFQRPNDGQGGDQDSWKDRPDHDHYYPEIAVPIEWIGEQFSILANQNQSIWVDIYIPKSAKTGLYQGTVAVTQRAQTVAEIPVKLQVRNFSLPDRPTAKTMVFLGSTNLSQRYAKTVDMKKVRDRHFQLAHRHKISLIDADPLESAAPPPDHPSEQWQGRLNGSLFTEARGYRGPGIGTGNGVYSIGTYGSWAWKSQGETAMRAHTDAWESWFQANSPETEHFLYLVDESTNFKQTETWASWISHNPGLGGQLKSFATTPLPAALTEIPDLNITASWLTVGDTSTWQKALDQIKNNPKKRFFAYNSNRPAAGTFATEDDGIALRELPWAQYKKNIDRWFLWESTYYTDYQAGRGETNVFLNAQTFGGTWNHSNGDGVLFYPGTDKLFPADSYEVPGPIASLRMKQWRRGIQDVDYLTLAKSVNPLATQAIVDKMVPRAFWEYGVDDPRDPTWVKTGISWSVNPDDWENARKQLASIIDGTPAVLIEKNPLSKSEKIQAQSSGAPLGLKATIKKNLRILIQKFSQ